VIFNDTVTCIWNDCIDHECLTLYAVSQVTNNGKKTQKTRIERKRKLKQLPVTRLDFNNLHQFVSPGLQPVFGCELILHCVKKCMFNIFYKFLNSMKFDTGINQNIRNLDEFKAAIYDVAETTGLHKSHLLIRSLYITNVYYVRSQYQRKSNGVHK